MWEVVIEETGQDPQEFRGSLHGDGMTNGGMHLMALQQVRIYLARGFDVRRSTGGLLRRGQSWEGKQSGVKGRSVKITLTRV